METILINQAYAAEFVMLDTNGAAVTGLGTGFTVTVSKNGGAFGASAGTKAEIGSGWYSYTITAAEADTAGPLALTITGAGAVQQNLLYQVAGYIPSPASSNLYCTLADLKSQDVLKTPSTATDDTFLTTIITAVSRAIDNETGRYFYKSSAHEIRYFTARAKDRCFVGDVVSVTALYTDTNVGDRTYPSTWAATDYDLWPYDADVVSEPEPFRFLDKSPRGQYQFPVNVPKGVKLDAIFGWPQVPAAINRACLLWSARIFRRYQSVLGVMSATPFGQQLVQAKPDPDVAAILSNYRAVAL